MLGGCCDYYKERTANLVSSRRISSSSLYAISVVITMTPKKMDTARRGVGFPHACQSMSMFSCGMWYNSPNAIKQCFFFFPMEMHLQMSDWLAVTRLRSFVMEPETWPDYMFCNETPNFTWTFQLMSLARGFIIDSLEFLDPEFWLSGIVFSIWCPVILPLSSWQWSHSWATFLPQHSGKNVICTQEATSRQQLVSAHQ
jgi:hypothetical protein